jgi:hypothetical protein
MTKWAMFGVVVLAVGAVGAGVATGAGTQKVRTKVTAKAVGDPATAIKGKVKARKNGHTVRKCIKQRKVTVRHAGTKVGSDTTNRKGKYSVPVDAYSEPGEYRVKVKRKNPRGPITCTAARRSINL